MNTLERAELAAHEALSHIFDAGGPPIEQRIALAVLKAIREPDEGMIEAGARYFPDVPEAMPEDDAVSCWQAMLDYIITEGEGKTGA